MHPFISTGRPPKPPGEDQILIDITKPFAEGAALDAAADNLLGANEADIEPARFQTLAQHVGVPLHAALAVGPVVSHQQDARPGGRF